MVSQDVVEYIETLRTKAGQEWQSDILLSLREAVTKAVPDAQERIQWGKPHFLKNGKYLAVISAAKAAVTFTIFNAESVEAPHDGFFEPGTPERKTVKAKKGQELDYQLLGTMVKKASAGL